MKTAVVNGQEISAEAVNFELDRLVRFYMGHGMTMAEIRQNLPKLEAKALDQAIGAKLLLDQAARLDIPVTEKDIDAEVARVVQQVGGEENYKKALAAQGISEADFRKELEKGARVNMLVNQACAHVADPTEDEVTAFYEAHKAEYVEPHQVLCQHILVKGSNDAALDKIKEIRERIVNDKADFAEEAKKHSDCPSGAQGGSLGWFGRGMMVPEFDKAAFEDCRCPRPDQGSPQARGTRQGDGRIRRGASREGDDRIQGRQARVQLRARPRAWPRLRLRAPPLRV